MKNLHSVLILFSGGLDSTTLLYALRAEGRDVVALSFRYGQRHARETDAAKEIATFTKTRLHVIELSAIQELLATGSLTGSATVPDGHYTDLTMKQTIVPNRNMIFLSLAAGAAITFGCGEIAYAAHAGDHYIYPDCRPTFVEAMRAAIALCDDNPPQLVTPFLHLTKEEIVRRGASLQVPFELTWSCYKGGEQHCGRCGTCVERREAFTLAGIEDPTVYQST